MKGMVASLFPSYLLAMCVALDITLARCTVGVGPRTRNTSQDLQPQA